MMRSVAVGFNEMLEFYRYSGRDMENLKILSERGMIEFKIF